MIELDADATKMLGNYTPANNASYRDLDLGSTSPVLLGDGILAQGGKDRLIRLISIKDFLPHAAHHGATRVHSFRHSPVHCSGGMASRRRKIGRLRSG